MQRPFSDPTARTRSVQDADDQLQQQFHLENQDFFRDYEELEDSVQQLLYDKPSTLCSSNNVAAKHVESSKASPKKLLSAHRDFLVEMFRVQNCTLSTFDTFTTMPLS